LHDRERERVLVGRIGWEPDLLSWRNIIKKNWEAVVLMQQFHIVISKL
jgi:hypothetical protein